MKALLVFGLAAPSLCLHLPSVPVHTNEAIRLRPSAPPALAASACAPPRAAPTMAATGECVVIELSSEDPVSMAKVLRQAWMEGGMKRGLEGVVIVPDDNSAVQIVAQGKPDRVQAFADWCDKELARDGKPGASTRMVDECPSVPLSSKFKLADMPRGKAKCAPGDGSPEGRARVRLIGGIMFGMCPRHSFSRHCRVAQFAVEGVAQPRGLRGRRQVDHLPLIRRGARVIAAGQRAPSRYMRPR